MTRTTTYVAGIVLAVAFLTAVNVQADVVTFSFSKADSTDRFSNVAKALSLTATKNENNGIDFLFTSSWDSGNGNGGRGRIIDSPSSQVLNTTDIFLGKAAGMFVSGEGGKIVTNAINPYRVRTSGITDMGDGIWGMEFTLNFAGNNVWKDFTDLVTKTDPSTAGRDDVYFTFHLGNLDDASANENFASFVTNSGVIVSSPGEGNASPEPATLAVLGMGLAGLGLVSRRRRK